MPPSLADPALWSLTQAKVLLWLLVLVRITGLLSTLPGLGQERLPVAVRAALGVLLATVVAPVIPKPAQTPAGAWELLEFLVLEFATGLFMGLMVAWILEAASYAGQIMDFQMGFSFVQFLDPATAQTASVSATVLGQVVFLFIFVSGLHTQMILALVDSYRLVGIGQCLPLRPQELVATLGLLLAKGFQLAFPVILVLFFIDVLEGISAKFMPQLQLIQLAFPLKIAVGVLVLASVIRHLGAWVAPLLEWAPRQAFRLMGG